MRETVHQGGETGSRRRQTICSKGMLSHLESFRRTFTMKEEEEGKEDLLYCSLTHSEKKQPVNK